MYVSGQMVEDMIASYGSPRRAEFHIESSREEYEFIRASQKHGRKHDFTIYVVKDGLIVVNAKHFYPPHLYRAPSGGLRPGEDYREGIRREMREELGCEIDLERFLLLTHVAFACGESSIDWNSYVFQARYNGGDFQFTDHREIREVRLASLEEFEEFSRTMRRTGRAGFHYRAALHDAVKGLLEV